MKTAYLVSCVAAGLLSAEFYLHGGSGLAVAAAFAILAAVGGAVYLLKYPT